MIETWRQYRLRRIAAYRFLRKMRTRSETRSLVYWNWSRWATENTWPGQQALPDPPAKQE